jgi:hypothetical protein
MGYVSIDHRNGQNPDGSKGTLVEYDTVSCRHCQAIIQIRLRGVNREVRTPYHCARCNGPICKFCGEQREGQCTPFWAMVDEAISKQKNLEWFDYHYRTVTR